MRIRELFHLFGILTTFFFFAHNIFLQTKRTELIGLVISTKIDLLEHGHTRAIFFVETHFAELTEKFIVNLS